MSVASPLHLYTFNGGTADDSIGGANGTAVSNVTIAGEVPTGNAIGGVTLSGDTSAAAGGFGFLFYGPLTVSQNYGYKFALEAKPNEPRADIYMPTTGASAPRPAKWGRSSSPIGRPT